MVVKALQGCVCGNSGYWGPGITQTIDPQKDFLFYPCTQTFWTITERDFHG